MPIAEHGSLLVLDTDQGVVRATLKAHRSPISEIVPHPGEFRPSELQKINLCAAASNFVLSCGSDGSLVWDIGKASPLKPLGRANVGEIIRSTAAKLHVLQVRVLTCD